MARPDPPRSETNFESSTTNLSDAAAALDHIEIGTDLFGAVDGQVEVGVGVDGEKGDAEGRGLLLGALGGGEADDIGEGTALEECAELVNDEGGGRSGSEAENLKI